MNNETTSYPGLMATTTNGTTTTNVSMLANKSKTFPEGCQMKTIEVRHHHHQHQHPHHPPHHPHHQRSLSESKTTDVIPLIIDENLTSTCPHMQTQRTRYNSCTDSNTSGVSSSDSVTGKGTNTG